MERLVDRVALDPEPPGDLLVVVALEVA